jgi:hypothetical protein
MGKDARAPRIEEHGFHSQHIAHTSERVNQRLSAPDMFVGIIDSS